MSLFDKYKLVPFTNTVPQILQQPEVKKLSDLDYSMKEILGRDLDETLKARLYEAALQTFLVTKMQIHSDKPKSVDMDVKAVKSVSEILYDVVPEKFREKAAAFYTQLQNTPEFVVNPDSTYTYKGIRHADSNVIELIAYLMKPNSAHTKAPVGFQEFINNISALNVPVSFIPYKKRVQQIQKAKKKLEWQPL